jgi:peptidoglycan/xylan/chitin deacetylase (PgdA/CDA1 family)
VPTGYWGKRPGWIKSTNHPFWQERVISREVVQDLGSNPLITIGSHTVTHPNLLKLNTQEAAREMTESKAELEDLLGRSVESFSFPHGAYNASLLRLAQETGYNRLFTIEPRLMDASNPGAVLGRVETNPTDYLFEFYLKINGAYRWQVRRHHLIPGRIQDSC